METVLKVRLAAKREGQSLRGIAKQYRLSRNTVRRYVRGGETEPHYQRHQEHKPKLGPYLADLEQLLTEDATRPVRERRSALLLFEELQRCGYPGAYDSVRRHVQGWKREYRGPQEVFIPLRFAAGEAFQFDWGEETLVLGGQTTKVSFAHLRLCHSRVPICIGYRNVTSILQHGLDQVAPPSRQLSLALPEHPNLRGRDYYHA
jgi:transposase